MYIGLPTQRLFFSKPMALLGSGVDNLPVLAYTDLTAPVVSPAYVIEGLVLTLPEGLQLPSALDSEGLPISTTFLSIVTLCNIGTESVKLKHNSSVCDPANKMYFSPENDFSLQSKTSITLFYRQIPNRTGWWHFKT